MMSRKSFTLRLPADDHTALRLYAALAAPASMNHIIRQAVINHLRDPHAPPQPDPEAATRPRARIPVYLTDAEHQALATYATRVRTPMNVVAAHAVHLFLAEPGRAAMLQHVMRVRREGGQ